jgi:prepilin-type N-terminal cleavage/methylation domain-containing protein
MSFLKNKHGFTLVELVVSLALLGMVIAVLFLMFSFENKNYLDSNKRVVIQSDVRLAIDSVLKESRFSTELKIMDVSTCESEIAAYKPYNYIYVKNGSLYQMIYNSATSSYQQRVVASSISNTNTNPVFSKISDNTLGITLTAQDKEDTSKSFSASSNIVLKNFEIISPKPVIEGTTGLAIRYWCSNR